MSCILGKNDTQNNSEKCVWQMDQKIILYNIENTDIVMITVQVKKIKIIN